MSKTLLIFKTKTIENLREKLKTNNGLLPYFSKEININNDDFLVSDIVPATDIPKLLPDKVKEADNAILLHQYLRNLDEIQASDKRLWASLSHVDFRDYVIKRWPLPFTLEEIKEDQVKRDECIRFVLTHWFISSENDRSLRRNALARLWWAAHLTRAPWEKDPEYFGHLKNENEYVYTQTLLIQENVYSELMERHYGRFSRILITILEFLRQHPEFEGRKYFRPLQKELNLQSGFRRIALLPYKELFSLIEEIAGEVRAMPSNKS